jgi:hypothetical protein
MDFVDWLNVNLNEVRETALFKMYFSSVPIEKGIDVFYILNANKGIDVIVKEGFIVNSVHFYSGKQDGIVQFTETLPFNLSFDLSKEKIINLLGTPDSTGGGDFSFLYGKTPFWIKYEFERFYFHTELTENESQINLITIGSK